MFSFFFLGEIDELSELRISYFTSIVSLVFVEVDSELVDFGVVLELYFKESYDNVVSFFFVRNSDGFANDGLVAVL